MEVNVGRLRQHGMTNASFKQLWRAYAERNKRYEVLSTSQREIFDTETEAIKAHNAAHAAKKGGYDGTR